jgi:hypothetical protein
MQQVVWDCNLSFFAQNSSFRLLVEDIIHQARQGVSFYPPETYVSPPVLGNTEHQLIERDLVRTSVFRVSEYGAERIFPQQDRTYLSRDREQNSRRGEQAFFAATLILRDDVSMQHPPREGLQGLLIQKYFNNSTVNDCATEGLPRLEFDVEWLSSASRIPALWYSLHHTLANPPECTNKFDITLWLSALAFGEQADMDIVEILASFYRNEEMKYVILPPPGTLELSRGSILDMREVRSVLNSFTRPFPNPAFYGYTVKANSSGARGECPCSKPLWLQ